MIPHAQNPYPVCVEPPKIPVHAALIRRFLMSKHEENCLHCNGTDEQRIAWTIKEGRPYSNWWAVGRGAGITHTNQPEYDEITRRREIETKALTAPDKE